MDQGSNKNHSPAYNFTPTVTKFCVMWEGLSLPHDTKFGNCRCKIVDSRSFHSWSLIHGLRWSGLIKVGPGLSRQSQNHYSDVIMIMMASQITRLTIVHSTLYWFRHRLKKTSKLRVTGLCVTGEFPAQMASNTENVSIWWRHHVVTWSNCFSSHTKQVPPIVTRFGLLALNHCEICPSLIM